MRKKKSEKISNTKIEFIHCSLWLLTLSLGLSFMIWTKMSSTSFILLVSSFIRCWLIDARERRNVWNPIISATKANVHTIPLPLISGSLERTSNVSMLTWNSCGNLKRINPFECSWWENSFRRNQMQWQCIVQSSRQTANINLSSKNRTENWFCCCLHTLHLMVDMVSACNCVFNAKWIEIKSEMNLRQMPYVRAFAARAMERPLKWNEIGQKHFIAKLSKEVLWDGLNIKY